MKSNSPSTGKRVEHGALVDLDLERRRLRREEKVERAGQTEEKSWKEQVQKVSRGLEKQRKREEIKEKRAKEAALYSDLRSAYNAGSTTAEDVKSYLENFPPEEEREAYRKLADAIDSGEIEDEIGEFSEDATRKLSFKERLAKNKQRRGVETIKAFTTAHGLTDKGLRRPSLVERVKLGVAGTIPRVEGMAEWSADEWYRALLRQYATGLIDEDDLERFFVDFPEEAKRAHEKLLGEIKSEKKPEKGEDKFSREEIEEMFMRSLGVREELIKDIPIEEGRTLFEEMLDDQIEIFKGAMLDAVSRVDYEKKIQELGGDREKAERELITQEAKKFLAVRELFTHGVTGVDKKTGQIVLKRYSDLDGKCAVALFNRGLNLKKIAGYLTPGEIRQGQATVDSGNSDGMAVESAETVDPKTGERKKEVSAVFDHHGPHSDGGTSATKVIYEVFTKLGLLKFKDEREKKNYEKVVEWVTQSDNFDMPRLADKVSESEVDLLSRWNYNKPKDRLTNTESEKLREMTVFGTSDLRMVGFLKAPHLTLDTLLRFADSGREITDVLTESDLRKFGLKYKKKDGEMVDHTETRNKEIKKTLEIVRELEQEKWVVETEEGKRFLVDTQNKIGGEGQWAAASIGFDGVIRYTPENHNFFIALNNGTFDKKTFAGLPQGKLVRGSVFIKLAGGEKLTVTLGDLIGRVVPEFEPEKDSGLDKFLEVEPRRIRAIVSQSPEGWWWTNAPDGTKVIIFDRDIPKNFKSGQEAYIRLASPRPEEADDEQERLYGVPEFYVGRFESDEIIFPKKVEVKKESVKAEGKPVEQKVEVKKEPEKPEVKVSKPAELAAGKLELLEEERKKIYDEAVRVEEKRLLREFLEKLKNSSFYGKWTPEAREKFAREQIRSQVENAKKELRKKYGL